MSSLFTAVVETLTTVSPAEPVEAEETLPDPDMPAYLQLKRRLRVMEDTALSDLRTELTKLEEKRKTESESLQSYLKLDIKQESRKPDFDRESVAKMAAEAEVSQQILEAIDEDIYRVNQAISKIHREYGIRQTQLANHIRVLDETRRAVIVKYVTGERFDADHAARWLGQIDAARNWLTNSFPDDAELVETFLTDLTHYKVPESTTELLWGYLHKKNHERFAHHNPNNPENKTEQ